MLSNHVCLLYTFRGCIQYRVCSVFHEDSESTVILCCWCLCLPCFPTVMYHVFSRYGSCRKSNIILHILFIWTKEQNPFYRHVAHSYLLHGPCLQYSVITSQSQNNQVKFALLRDFILCYYKVYIYQCMSYDMSSFCQTCL
jgi:hypothetical protein